VATCGPNLAAVLRGVVEAVGPGVAAAFATVQNVQGGAVNVVVEIA
jgi:hypothetical protein